MDRSEARSLVRKALDINSLVACSQVCKAWNQEFTPFIWHTVDLKASEEFKELEPEIIARHGHYIRVVRNIRKRSELDLFTTGDKLSVCRLESLAVTMKNNKPGFQLQLVRWIQGNIGTLTTLRVWGDEKSGVRIAFPLEEALFGKSKSKAVAVDPRKKVEDAAVATTKFETTAANDEQADISPPKAIVPSAATMSASSAPESSSSTACTASAANLVTETVKELPSPPVITTSKAVAAVVAMSLSESSAATAKATLKTTAGSGGAAAALNIMAASAASEAAADLDASAVPDAAKKEADTIAAENENEPEAETEVTMTGTESTKSPTAASIPMPLPLRSLNIRYMRMSRSCFSRILKKCPNLEGLVIRKTVLTESSSSGKDKNKDQDQDDPQCQPSKLFQHKRLNNLWASLQQVFNPSNQEWTSAPCLLAHFPNLSFWETWSSQYTVHSPSATEIRPLISQYCLRLGRLSVNDSVTAIPRELMTKAMVNAFSIRLRYRCLSPSTVWGMLVHASTLKTIRTYDQDVGVSIIYGSTVPYLKDHFQNGWMIHMLLSKCSMVEVVDMPSHEMDMDVVEQFEWACKGLKELRIRIKGLRTKELILRVVEGWAKGVCARRRGFASSSSSSSSSSSGSGNNSNSSSSDTSTLAAVITDETVYGADDGLEVSMTRTQQREEDEQTQRIIERAVDHLLRFEQLSKVWLGYKLWSI
ncbi:hypothetical protein EDD11_003667 [Mortierella claussenii]|nr:hypothetical protein EDD11_003667 [Mortierella claussenii]